MSSVREIEAQKFVNTLKERLKTVKELSPPKWAGIVKTGINRTRPPQQEDFWFIRSASILRKLYIEDSAGVERLSTYYGGRKKFGLAPPHFRKGSRNTLRKILQQLEKAGMVEKVKSGRKLTSQGRSFLEKAAKEAG